MFKSLRLWLWVVVAALGLIVVTTTVLLRQAPQAATGFGGGTYSLVDQTGKPIDQTMFQGHPSMLFFGFTHCPDVCPTTLAEMASWFEALGDEGKDLHGYFVSIDPERDTPAIIGDYVSFVSSRITGVTGELSEIDKMAKAWGIYYQKVPVEGADYTMDHTATVFLLNAKGEFEGTITYGEPNDTALGKLHKLLAKS